MKNRRLDERKLMNTQIRLYHPSLGRFESVATNISNGGVALQMTRALRKIRKMTETCWFRPVNADVLFSVKLLRHTKDEFVLKFID